ncbi:hypothetical protein K503DRAFT_774279 [Rhizopogon vinicolor AM-OR11-026]|uniref:Pheromone n=1 Tax=Rhizopogon vinicolor AM-OR11-026 TaxID=1314800 RepID=A0A1B7MQ08_9AGAM|nr:hypothetical protein K503DRAFT_774279 [Rhizopogon vinicolor AM-OR11-026]
MDNFTSVSDIFFPTVSLEGDPSNSGDPNAVGDGEPVLVDAEYWTWGSSSQSGFCVIV